MSYKELIEALRTEGEKTLGLIRSEAEEEIRKTREGVSARIGDMRKRFDRMRADVVDGQSESLLLEAGREARMSRLIAEKELADRLFGIAEKALPLLRNEDYADVFGALAAELPPSAWETVRINPEDRETARRHFPSASLVPDPAISGGFEVMTSDGRVRVMNTFEKRLEKAWPDILPQVIKEIREHCKP